jgi:hypothetical protein
MNYLERKKELKGDLEGLKDDLLTIENKELIQAYEKEIFNKSLELEDVLLRITYLSCN